MAAVVVFFMLVFSFCVSVTVVVDRIKAKAVTGNIPLFISAGCSPTCIRYPFLEESEEL